MKNNSKTTEIIVPEGIEEVSPFEKLKFLMILHFTYKNLKTLDVSTIELDLLLDYVSAINQILNSETHNKVRLFALETLGEVIDVILKYFSMSFMSSLRHSERLMIIAILVKRNCFPIFCVPARQPTLDLSYLEEESADFDADARKIETLKQNSQMAQEIDKFVKAVDVSEEVLTKSVTDLMERVKLRLLSGIDKDEFARMSLDEMQAVSLMMNDKDFVLVQMGERIQLRRHGDLKDLTPSESVIVKPTTQK